MILQNKEADVLERMRIGMNQKQISEGLKISVYLVGNIVNRLIEKSAVQKLNNGNYKVLLDTYDRSDDTGEHKDKMTVFIPDGFEEYIRGHYGKIPRKELARRLNLDKFTLNQMIIQIRG